MRDDHNRVYKSFSDVIEGKEEFIRLCSVNGTIVHRCFKIHRSLVNHDDNIHQQSPHTLVFHCGTQSFLSIEKALRPRGIIGNAQGICHVAHLILKNARQLGDFLLVGIYIDQPVSYRYKGDMAEDFCYMLRETVIPERPMFRPEFPHPDARQVSLRVLLLRPWYHPISTQLWNVKRKALYGSVVSVLVASSIISVEGYDYWVNRGFLDVLFNFNMQALLKDNIIASADTSIKLYEVSKLKQMMLPKGRDGPVRPLLQMFFDHLQ
nr:hypothetical protein [Tanacetum cinerariifolium]